MSLLTNKSRLEEACTETMNERCSAALLNKLPSREKDPWSSLFLVKLWKLRSIRTCGSFHLSRFENPHMKVLTEREIADKFSNEHLMVLKSKFNNDEPWYADFVNYIIGKVVPLNWTFEKRKRFFLQVKTYFWEEPYAFKLCADNIMRRCVAGSETLEILVHCHSGPTSGHHSANVTAKKVYEFGFYWPSIFKDTNEYVWEVFDVWELDFMGPFPQSKVNIEHIMKVSEKAHIVEHKRRVQESLLILTTYTTYHSRSIRGLEKSINQSNLESCESLGNKSDNDSDLEKSIRRIYSFNTSYSVTRMRETDEMHVLEKHKGAIAWKMSDIKGISPSLCTHKILIEDDFKPFIQSQRRLNPKVQDVVSPIHVVPKKRGMTVVLNDDNELIPSRTVTRWRVCINYRKLIDATQKDHFPLPFIDQMLKRLCGNEYYYFLDGFSGFFPKFNRTRRSRKENVHLSLWDFCLLTNVVRIMQRTCNFSKMHDGIFPTDMVEDFMEVFMDDLSVFDNLLIVVLLFSIEFLLDEKKSTLVVELGKVLLGYKAKAVEIHKSTMNSIPLYRDVEPRLISWVLLLQSFDIEIKDKKGAKNLAAYHLSRLENPDLGAFTKEEIADEFPDEHLMILKAELNDDAPLCLNNVMRRCVAGNEILEILAHCHSGPTRGHHSASITGRKIYESGFFWPSIYKGQTSCFMELNVLMELRDGAYEKTRIYKERTKKWHNSRLRGDKDFRVGDKVLLFNRDLDAIREKLKSKWYGPNVVKIVYPYGTVEITDKNGISFKVNGQRLKKYYDGHMDTGDKEVVEFEENTT
ncbi:hypothetical protein Tco_1503191 [Tanacetum coccineum]